MKNTTAKNDIQVVLCEFLEKRKAMKVAEEVYAVMQGETQHTHNGKNFFVKEDKTGALVLTMESMTKKAVSEILHKNLEEDEAEECLKELMDGNISTKIGNIRGIETIQVEGSDSEFYSNLAEYIKVAENGCQIGFLEKLNNAIKVGVRPFEVPVCDPSIDENGHIQFVAGCKPAVGYSYNELEELASKNSVQLGSKKQYVLFLATIIQRLMAEGYSTEYALKAVCNNSIKLGHYRDSADAKGDFEPTGSRKIVGKCDLANTCKILARDEDAGGFWLAGGGYFCYGHGGPLASINFAANYNLHYASSVGWFVL